MRSRAIKGHHGESPNRLLSTDRHTDRRTRTPPSSLQPPHRPAPLPYTSNHHRKTDGRLPLRNQGGKAEAGSTDEDPGMLKSLSRSTPPIPAVQTSLRSAAQFAAARTSHPTPERFSPPCRRGARLTQGGGRGRGVSALLQSEGWRWKTYDANQQEQSEVVRSLATVVANIHFSAAFHPSPPAAVSPPPPPP